MKNRKPTRLRNALNTANAHGRAFSGGITIEDYLKQEYPNGYEFLLKIHSVKPDGTMQIYIHPLNRDGETYDAYVKGFDIQPKQAIDNLVKYLSQSYPK